MVNIRIIEISNKYFHTIKIADLINKCMQFDVVMKITIRASVDSADINGMIF